MILKSRKKNSIYIIFKNKFIWFLLYLINSPLLILIILIYPFFRIRINELETRSIGHFSITTEIFLAELENNIHDNKKGIFIWFINDKISNNFLLNKWKNKILIGPRIILYPLFSMINKFKFLHFMKSPFRHWHDLDLEKKNLWQIRDIYQVLQKTAPILVFNEKEIQECKNYFKKVNIEKEKYLCFFARTYHFRNDVPSVRDADINNQVPGLINICKKYSLKAVRIGDKNQPEIVPNSDLLIDYPKSENKNSMLDIYLPMNCKFMIGSNSGISYVPILNRKKTLIVDFSQFHDLDCTPDYYVPVIIPKKYRNISTKKIMNYSKVFELGLTQIQYDEELLDKGYETVPNSKEEILLAIDEMNDLINLNKESIENTILQKKFWGLFENYYSFKRPLNLKIANSFLDINQDYIN